MSNITHVDIRMYKLGTGDFFALQFFKGGHDETPFKMLIDAGAWSGKKAVVEEYVLDLKTYMDHKLDVLVVTHEHKDHVHAFDACEELFTEGLEVGEVWMAWTENDKVKKIKEWKDKYGEKKKALGLVAQKMAALVKSPEYLNEFEGNKFAARSLGARILYSEALDGFADLHLSAVDKVYKGGLAGMNVVKEKIKPLNGIKYFHPGDVVEDIEGLPGVKIYVLGPPNLYDDVRIEAGGDGESYRHNDELGDLDAFAAAASLDSGQECPSMILPFDEGFVCGDETPSKKAYDCNDWRRIDHDWMFSSSSLALRMMGLTNNLSLALAFEFEESKKVMLFPGDAEFGSWTSWHQIKWKDQKKGKDAVHLTKDLLNRTVFYKVAHHLSHNGTAQAQGLEMMTDKKLVAMATLDYNVISNGWKNTMPNRAIIKELLQRTKGRLMIMNEADLYYDEPTGIMVSDKIEEARAMMTKKEARDFEARCHDEKLYIQYTLEVS